MVSDLDQRNTSNSKVTMTMISQKPLVPQIKLNQIDGRMAQLTFEGCFNYDVRLSDLLLQHQLAAACTWTHIQICQCNI